ncbi:MAG: twin-arginine translocase subunit TatC [Candidatus Eremiobacteraeota bacterium]|nr:twin-arginine translocase subunit TatC [Candidatus Eremiobacteraeota bacterium]
MTDEKKMTLVGHLEELRLRIVYSIAVWILCTIGAYFLTPPVLSYLTGMLHTKLVFINPAEAFMAYFKVALTLGLFAALPVILHQTLLFIVPGLEPHEKKWVLLLVPMAVLLFFAGLAFACLVLIPATLGFFLSFQTESLTPMITIGGFVSFVTTLVIMSGLIFQMPLVILFLGLIGIVNSRFLREKRRYAVFAIFVIAAIATPTPDAFTMTIVALPMVALYEISLLLVWIIERKKRPSVTQA